ncbi:MAG: FliH/SctL family protein, partial [Planctomycetota bacterium]
GTADPEVAKSASQSAMSGLAGFNLDDLANQGRTQLDATRQEIKRLLEQATQDAVRIRAEAKQLGHAEGLQQAEADVQKRVQKEANQLAQQQVATLQTATKDLHRIYEEWMQQYAGVLNESITAAVEKIVRRRVEEDSGLIVRWTEDALRQTRAATRLTVAVHPETLAQLGQELDELVTGANLPEQIEVVADETLTPTDVVIRQTGGEVDAGMRSQIERLREMLA